MNYASKFDGKLFLDGVGTHAKGHAPGDSVSPHTTHAPADAIIVPDAHLLFNGDFKRSGVDLILSAEDQKLVLHDYFKGEKRAALASPDGAHLTGDIVKALAGHVEYAQAADGSASVNKVIGHVTKLAGTATAIRNGVSIILNQGDNVEKGDVVQSGSGSTLGITFIDGTVFGLSSNARMVLNEMVYDPNGSNNSSLLSLVAGTITFVAGETAKHGDMKIDTPVATMGIRGTAVLVEIDFDTSGQNGLPDTKFQVLVEPDGTTGSYILFDKVTLTPFAIVDKAGTQFSFSNGNFSQSLTGLTPEIQKLITDVFAQRFSDNTNTKTFDHHTDFGIPDSLAPFKVGNITVTPIILTVNTPVNTPTQTQSASGPQIQHIAGPPGGVIVNAIGQASTDFKITEIPGVTGSATSDKVSGAVNFVDINAGDQPTVSAKFDGSTYTDPHGHTLSLNSQQLADIKAVEVDLAVTQTPGNNNNGSASWSYTVPDGSFDFLAAGETLQLTYTLTVDNNYAPNDEKTDLKFTITITGTNDVPVITTGAQTINFAGGKGTVGGDLAPSSETPGVNLTHPPGTLTYKESGTFTFTDPDLTDTHTIVPTGPTGDLTGASLSGTTFDLATLESKFPGPFQIFENALAASIATDSTGTGTGTINWTFAELPTYVADFIPSGQTLTLTYTVEVKDSQGAISTQTITVTIAGNDTPAVVWIDTKAAPPSGALWSDGSNWETGKAPTISDDTIIITNQLQPNFPTYPVVIDSTASAKTLAMNDVTGKAPELDNNSTLTVAGELDLNVDAVLKNFGDISVGTLATLLSISGLAEVLGHSVLQNSGTIELAHGGDFLDKSSITNSGVIEISGDKLNVQVAIANAGGTIQVDGGTALNVNDGAVITKGNLTIGSLGVLDIEKGTATLTAGTPDATLDGVTVTGTDAVAGLPGTPASLIEIGATTSGVTLLLDDGTLIKNGNLTIAGGSTLDVESAGGATLDGVSVTGSGTTGPTASLIEIGASTTSGSILTLDDGTAIKNGTLTIAGGSTLAIESSTGATLDDVNVTGTGTRGPSASLIEIGASTTSGSILTLDDGTIIKNGALTIAGGSTLDVESAGGATLDGVSVTGSGTTGPMASLIEIGASTTSGSILTLDDGTAIKNGTVTIAGGSKLDVESTGGATLDGVDVTGTGTTGPSASLIEIGASTTSGSILTLDDGTIIKNGALTIAGGSKLDVESTGGATLDGVNVMGTGTTGPSASLIEIGASTTSGSILTLDDATIIKNGTLTIAGGSTLDVESTGGATLDGVDVTGTGTTGPSASLIEIGAGTTSGSILTLDDATIIKNGTVAIAGGSTLDVESTGGATLDGVNVTGTGTTGPSASLIEIGATTTSGSILTLDDGTTIKNGALAIATGSALDIEGIGGATLDGVTVSGGGAINVDGAIGGPATIPATLTLEGGATITGGTLTNGSVGTLDVESASGATLDDVTVIGGGAIEVSETTSGAILTLTDGTTVTDGTLDIATGGEIYIQNGNGSFGATLDHVAITGGGEIEIGTSTNPPASPGSTLILADGTTISGVLLTLDDTTDVVDIEAGTHGDGVTFGNMHVSSLGTLSISDGATLTLNDASIDGGTINDGTAGGTGHIDVTGLSAITNAILSNGDVTIATGTILTLDGDTVNGTTISGTDLTSIIRVGASSGSILTLDDGASIVNGELTIAGGSTLDVESTGGATLDGVDVTGTGTTGPSASLIEIGASTTSGSILTLDDGTIIKNGALTIAGGSTLDVESIGGATLDGVDVTGTGTTGPSASLIEIGAGTTSGSILTLDDATIIKNGTVAIAGGSTLDVESTGGATLDGVSVTGTGTTGPSASLIEIGATTTSGSILTLDDGTTIKNGALAIAGGSKLDVESIGGATLDGVDVIGTGTTGPSASLIEIGATTTSGSILTLDDGTTIKNGALAIAGGSKLDVESIGGATLDGVDVTGTGTTGPSASLIEIGASTTSGSTLTLDDGAIIKSGTVTIAGGSTLDVESIGGATLDGVTVTNGGHIDIGTISTFEDPPLTLDDHTVITGGTITMGSLGVLDVKKGTALLANGTPDATLDDVTVTSSAAGSAITIGASGAATLLLTDGASTSGVNITVDAGSTLDLDSSTITGGILTVSGELDSTGTSFITDATIINSSHIDIVSGTLTIDPTPVTNSGTIEVKVGGTLLLSGETIANSVTTAEGTTNGIIKIDATESAHATLDLENSAIGGGTVTISGEMDSTGTSAINGAHVTNTGTVDVASGALTFDATSTLHNSGTTKVDSGATLTIHGSVDNSGTLETNGGTLVIGADAVITGTSPAITIHGGTADIVGTGAPLALNVSFSAAGTLVLEDSQHYGGIISGFGTGDKLGLVDLAYSSSETDVWDSVHHTLTITSGTQIETLHFAATDNFSQNDFAITSDANGHTELVSNAGISQPQVTMAGLDSAGNAVAGDSVTANFFSPSNLGSVTYTWLENGQVVQSGASDVFTPGANDTTKVLDVVVGFGSEQITNVAGTVAAPPSVSFNDPGGATTNSGTPLTLSSLNLSFADAGSDSFTVTLTAGHGTLSLADATGLSDSGSGTSALPLILTGTLAAIDTALGHGLVYTPTSGYAGSDTISLSALDGAFSSNTATLDIDVIGDPVITPASAQTIGLNETTKISGISLSETGNIAGETFTVTLTDNTHGQLSATALGGDGDTVAVTTTASGTILTITGSLSDVNSDLATLTDTNGTPGSDQITVTATDSFGNSATPQITSVTVNGPPTITIEVVTPNGLDFQQHNALTEMGSGTIQPGGTSTSFTIVDTADNLKFVLDGFNFSYGADGTPLAGGTLTSFHEFTNDSTPVALANFTGQFVDIFTWITDVQLAAAGTPGPIDDLNSAVAYNFIGGSGPDTFGSGGHADTLSGTGADFFNGRGAPSGSHDTETGGAGSTFVFAHGYGALTITNFDQDRFGNFSQSIGDHIQLNGLSSPLTVTYVNGNTVADFGNGDVLTLLHVNPANLVDSDFIGGGNGGNNANGPVISNANNTVTYAGTPVTLDAFIMVADTAATVSTVNAWISSGEQAGDQLTINGNVTGTIVEADGSIISYNFDPTLNTVSDNGHGFFLQNAINSPHAATTADFQAALQQIQFSPGATDGDRTVTWAANDGANFSPTETTTINVGPILNSFTLTVSEGGSTVLSNSDFNVSDPGFAEVTYTVGPVAGSQTITGGQFEVFNGTNWVSAPTGGFTNTQIAAGEVEFVQDGTATAPTFLIHVSDSGPNAGPDISPTVTFIPTAATIQIPAGTPDGHGGYVPVVSSDTIAFSDSNPLDVHTVNSSFDANASNLGALNAPIGEFSATLGHDTNIGNPGIVNWSFTLNSTDLLLLDNAGLLPNINEVYDVTIDNGHGGTTTQQILIDINGTALPGTFDVMTGAISAGTLAFAPTSSEVFELQGASISGSSGNGLSILSTDSNSSDNIVVETDSGSSISVSNGHDGISLVSGAANAIVFNAASSISATGTGSFGIYAFANGNVAVNDLVNTSVSGDQFGIGAFSENNGSGNVAVNVYANATINSTSSFGILAFNSDTGNIVVTTSSGDSIASGSAGIDAVNEDTSIATSANSVIDINASGTINSGSNSTGIGHPPAGIIAGYLGGSTDPSSYPVFGLYGTVIVNNAADIYAAAGDGIRTFNYGDGNVTVNDTATKIQALDIGQTPVNGFGNGISAENFGTGSIFVTTAAGTEIDSSSSGISAFDGGPTAPANSVVSVIAHGTIFSGSTPTGSGFQAAGILAGYDFNGAADGSVLGNVSIDDFASITAAAGTDGIRGYNYGTGTVTITVESGATVYGPHHGVDAFGEGGNVSVTNHGSITGGQDGIYEMTTGSGTVSVDNAGDLTGNIALFSGVTITPTITNEFGANWSLDGTNQVGGSALSNAGTIDSNGTSFLTGLASFTNTGAIEVQSGSLKMGSVGGITGTGSLKIDAGATLELASGASSGQTVTFESTTGVLKLDAAQNFHGTIAGFSTTDGKEANSDQIDLANINFNHLVTQTFDAVHDTMTVGDGSHTAVIQFTGNVGTLNLVSDGVEINGVADTSGTIIYDPPAMSNGPHMAVVPSAAPATSTISPTAPNQTLTGNAVSDTFVFNFANVGQATVTNFHAATDTLQFNSQQFANVQAALNATQDDGHGNTVITLDAHDSITLSGVVKAQLHANDFHFA